MARPLPEFCLRQIVMKDNHMWMMVDVIFVFSLLQHDNSQIKGTTSSLQTSSLEEFQMTVDKLNERDLEVKRARYELTLKTRSLDDKKERNRQTILELQMKSEHESGQLEELTKHRETLQQRYLFHCVITFRIMLM